MRRWAANYARLSPRCRARVTGATQPGGRSGMTGRGMARDGAQGCCRCRGDMRRRACLVLRSNSRAPGSCGMRLGPPFCVRGMPARSAMCRAASAPQHLPPCALPACPLPPLPAAVENDDVASAFSLQDLLFLHSLCGVPLVFDFHHHRVRRAGQGPAGPPLHKPARRTALLCPPPPLPTPLPTPRRAPQFCPGELSERDALLAAVQTWPRGVRPVVHWSESQARGTCVGAAQS